MGHKYIKEDDTFSTSRNGTVPKPTDQEVSDNKVLSAGGSWVEKGGGSGGSSTLDGLDDVDISSVSDGQGLFYDSTEQKWKNADPPSGGGDVTDVLQDGQSVVDANGVARITTPSVPSNLNDLSDVNTSSPSTDDFLGYDSQTNKWVNKPVSSGGGNVDDVQVNGISVVDENKVAKIKGYKEVTKAQYDALPASKESDGILYCIKDTGDVASAMYAPVIYSTEEQEIGVWTDGKPLYAVTKDLPSANSGTWKVAATLSSECVIKYWEGYIIDQNNYGFGIDGDYCNCGTNDDVGGSRLGFNTLTFCPRQNHNCTSGKVTLYYTKNTDIAGSGKWGTGGVPAHHYSTNEQVIGTWIDGKSVYEKTYALNLFQVNQQWTTSNITEPIDKVIKADLIDEYNQHFTCEVGLTETSPSGYYSVELATRYPSSSNRRFNYLIMEYTKTTD